MGDLNIKEVVGIEPIKINKDENRLRIQEVANIAPAAVHIKEVNHIDPLLIESLRVTEVKNLDPIMVEKFNVTSLPTVNVSLRQLPALDMNLRRLPPVSVGLHQDLRLPSSYLLRARLFGLEVLRINLCGETEIMAKPQYRREQARTLDRSYPETAVAGNPAIPSTCRENSGSGAGCAPGNAFAANSGTATPSPFAVNSRTGSAAGGGQAGPLSMGLPAMNFTLSARRGNTVAGSDS